MDVSSFQKTILTHYRNNRRDLPWRDARDPYKILVSEVMLQQTQVSRVMEKYLEFIQRFPTVEDLADASLPDLLVVWKGLGYNRRALFLHRAAKKIVEDFNGQVPETDDGLRSLPGIGSYTAAAIQAFAFNEPVVVIETNIRSVVIHFFFSDVESVSDKDILPLIEQTLYRPRPRDWYNALMDYGAVIKQEYNPSRKSASYTKQSPFEGSNRQARGRILELLMMEKKAIADLVRESGMEYEQIERTAEALKNEGFIEGESVLGIRGSQ
ncbi:MAG: A/G-specific adenine glycosylase [Nanobdellota archaeon]